MLQGLVAKSKYKFPVFKINCCCRWFGLLTLQKLRNYYFWEYCLPLFFPLCSWKALHIFHPLDRFYSSTVLAVIVPQEVLIKTDFPLMMFILSCTLNDLVPPHQDSGCCFEELYVQRWQFLQFTSSCLNWYFSFLYYIINTTDKYCLHVTLRSYKNHWDCWAKVFMYLNRWNCFDLLKIYLFITILT